MAKSILFQWTGSAPRESVPDHRWQVGCAAVFPSAAAFKRATDMGQAEFKNYVSVHELQDGDDPHNEGARLAIANPGVVYWQDTLNFVPRDAPWAVHPYNGNGTP